MALKAHQQSGMTLLEVLVAITLMVIISAMSFVGLNGLIDAKNQTDQVAQDLRKELLTSQQLNQDIQTMINRSVKNEQGAFIPAVVGGYTNIEFSRISHGDVLNQDQAKLQRVQWYLRNKKLYRRTINHLDRGSFAQWVEHAYLDKISDIAISYVNNSGIESRIWPMPENPKMQLKSINMHIELENDTELNFQWYPLL